MAVIGFISAKGGAGKTTAAVVLACELSKKAPTVLVDADPNLPVADWAEQGNLPENLTVVAEPDVEKIADCIEDLSGRYPYVIVDCEGRAELLHLYVASMSDLVIIPVQGSQLDAMEAAKSMRVVRRADKLQGHTRDLAIVLTKTNPIIRTKNLTHVCEQFSEQGIAVLDTELNEREAYRSIFSYGGGLDALPAKEVANLDKAQINAKALADEIANRLSEAEG